MEMPGTVSSLQCRPKVLSLERLTLPAQWSSTSGHSYGGALTLVACSGRRGHAEPLAKRVKPAAVDVRPTYAHPNAHAPPARDAKDQQIGGGLDPACLELQGVGREQRLQPCWKATANARIRIVSADRNHGGLCFGHQTDRPSRGARPRGALATQSPSPVLIILLAAAHIALTCVNFQVLLTGWLCKSDWGSMLIGDAISIGAPNNQFS